MKKVLLITFLGFLASSCASYRVNTNTELNAQEARQINSGVQILESSLPTVSYESLGNVEATVKKLTAFHKDPTREQVNTALAKEAKRIGANAVINTRYKKGIGLTTWGYIEASGLAVKKN